VKVKKDEPRVHVLDDWEKTAVPSAVTMEALRETGTGTSN
jgi:hypothetical protein